MHKNRNSDFLRIHQRLTSNNDVARAAQALAPRAAPQSNFICFQKSDAQTWYLSLKRKSGLHFLFERNNKTVNWQMQDVQTVNDFFCFFILK